VFNGDGSSYKPTGILNTSGINTHAYTSSPAAVQWSDVVQMEVELISDKVPLTPGRAKANDRQSLPESGNRCFILPMLQNFF
jgi:hypothetical protein